MSKKKRELFDQCFDELLEQDLIEPSQSSWVSQPVVVNKPGKSPRLVVDYRPLNSVTTSDKYPLPLIPDVLAEIGQAEFFSVFDLAKGFHQLQLQPEARQYTAFASHRGLHQFKVLPMGLKNSPATFERTIEQTLGNALYNFARCFMDDLTIFSKTFPDHLEHLDIVLTGLGDAGFTIKPSKVQLCAQRINLLGFIITPGKCAPNPEKVVAIKEFPIPQSKVDLQRWLGMINYYRQFITEFTEKATPLYNLLKGDVDFVFDENCKNAFSSLATALANATELFLPELNKPFTIECDASKLGLGATLLQEKDGILWPVAFASRTLSQAETNYCVAELECAAIIFATRKFRQYIDMSHFTVKTDHRSLQFLKTNKQLGGRLARWSLELQGMDFDIQYKSGKTNVAADCLSRAPLPVIDLTDGEESVKTNTDNKETKFNSLTNCFAVRAVEFDAWQIPVSRETIISEQRKDSKLLKIITELETGETKPDHPGGDKLDSYWVDSDGLLVRYFAPEDDDDELDQLHAWKIVVPRNNRESILAYFHDQSLAGHLGIRKTFNRLASQVTWSGLRKDVALYCKACQICQRVKASACKPTGLLQSISTDAPWARVSIDLMGPYCPTAKGHRWILVIVDLYTKWVEIFPLRNGKAEKIWECLMMTFSRFGFPRDIISDNGTCFTGKHHEKMCNLFSIKRCFVSPYHPQADPTERYNRTVKQMVISFKESHRDWDVHITSLAFALRTATNDTTGFTPAHLQFGRELRFPQDWQWRRPLLAESNPSDYAAKIREHLRHAFALTSENTARAQATQKFHYDKKHRFMAFQVGDLVWKEAHVLSDASQGITASLCKKRDGPYKVIEKRGKLSYHLGDRDTGKFIGRAHVSQKTKYAPPFESSPSNDATGTEVRKREPAASPTLDREITRITQPGSASTKPKLRTSCKRGRKLPKGGPGRDIEKPSHRYPLRSRLQGTKDGEKSTEQKTGPPGGRTGKPITRSSAAGIPQTHPTRKMERTLGRRKL